MEKNPLTLILEEKGINRSQMAQQSGLSYSTLSFIENGIVPAPRKQTFFKIAKFADKDPGKLEEDYQNYKKAMKTAAQHQETDIVNT